MTEPKIVRDPDILCGKPTIEGTRISVELVLDWLSAGWSVEQVREQYPFLTRDQVLACIAYAREVVMSERPAVAAE